MNTIYFEEARGTEDFPFKLYIMETETNKINVPLHRHYETEIIYITNGKIRITVDQTSFIGKSGDIYFFNSKEVHGIVSMTRDVNYTAFVFNTEILNMKHDNSFQTMYIAPVIKGEKIFPRVITGTCRTYDMITSSFDEMVRSYEKGEPSFQTAVISGLYTIFYALAREDLLYCPEDEKHMEDSKLREIRSVLKWINTHYNEKIYLKTLSDMVNMSPQYFSVIFKKHTNKTPFEYINSLKIQKAVTALETTDKQIVEIALECGFENLSNFNRKFKEYVHFTPSEYRKRLFDKHYRD